MREALGGGGGSSRWEAGECDREVCFCYSAIICVITGRIDVCTLFSPVVLWRLSDLGILQRRLVQMSVFAGSLDRSTSDLASFYQEMKLNSVVPG